MKAAFAQFCIGLLFGTGLIVSGMSNPAKVLNFLDVSAIATGAWDASLAFVMAGAVGVTFVGYKLVLRRAKPLMADRFHLPTRVSVDSRLVIGAALFGAGWGLAGFCPGPALVALASGKGLVVLFVMAMIAGMAAARWFAGRSTPAQGRNPSV